MAPEKAHRLTQDPAAGFEIGWDYGIRGLSPPPDAPRCIVDGVEAARQHSGTAVPRGRCDRFERKWMLMR